MISIYINKKLISLISKETKYVIIKIILPYVIKIRKFKTEDRNENCLKSKYEGHIKIRNPQQIYHKIRNPSEKITKIRGPENL